MTTEAARKVLDTATVLADPAHVSFWGIHDRLTAYRRKG